MRRHGQLYLVVIALWIGSAAPSLASPEPRGIYRGVSAAVRFDVSPPLGSTIPPPPFRDGLHRELPELATGLEGRPGPEDRDSIVQSEVGGESMPPPILSFDGPPNLYSVSPPQPVGDVGPHHYVAMSNLSFQIYDKAGNSLFGPAANHTLWSGLGGDCDSGLWTAALPIVLYDQFADRWLLTQVTYAGPTYYLCVALSTSPDPLGTYYRYAFPTGSNFLDSPRYGIWRDAYYINTREFSGGGATFAGLGVYAVNRARLLVGDPAPTLISFLVPPGANPHLIGDGLLPADIDGFALPPPASPGLFLGTMDDGGPYGAPQDAVTLWKFVADFANPPSSSFTLARVLPVAPFDSIFPCAPSSRECIPQPSTTRKLDVLSYRQRPTHRLAYRNFGTHESLVTSQSVEAWTNIAGMRWYEIRDPLGSPFIHQQGTYAPVGDGTNRWMGSVAMDRLGNMALGFSASDTVNFPSVRYTGRLVGDPTGTMPQGEVSIVNGHGSQLSSSRWGELTSMNVDPEDDCTFWYVNQWVPVTSAVGWVLRIGAFKFDECLSFRIFADGFDFGSTSAWSAAVP